MIRITTGSQALDELLGGNPNSLIVLPLVLNHFAIIVDLTVVISVEYWKGGIETSSITETFGEFR